MNGPFDEDAFYCAGHCGIAGCGGGGLFDGDGEMIVDVYNTRNYVIILKLCYRRATGITT